MNTYRGELNETVEYLDDQCDAGLCDVRVDVTEEGDRLSHQVCGLDVVRLLTKIILTKTQEYHIINHWRFEFTLWPLFCFLR